MGGFLLGALAGALGAVAVDAAVLAYEPVAPDAAALRAARPNLRWTPDARITRDHGLVGIRGVF